MLNKTKATLQGRPCHYKKSKQENNTKVIAGAQDSTKALKSASGQKCPQEKSHRVSRAALAYTPQRLRYAQICSHLKTSQNLGSLWLKPYTPEKFRSLVSHPNAGYRCSHMSNGYSFGSLACLRWRRLISPCIAATMNWAVLSPCSFTCSIASTTSCGARVCNFCDLSFFVPVAITELPENWWSTVYQGKKEIKQLKCTPLCIYSGLHLMGCILQETTKPGSGGTLTGPLTKPLIEVTVMAEQQHTQTRPKFTWLFLATHEHSPESAPITVRFEADTEDDARAAFPGMILTFAAKIRTESPYSMTWTDEEHATLWSVIGGNLDVYTLLPSQEVNHA